MAYIETLNGFNIAPKDAVRAFATVADMQAATDLAEDMVCHTNGFHEEGDGGAAYYTVSTEGTANGMDVLALQNSLYATLVVTEPYVTPEMFGAYGDGTHNDTDSLQAAINAANCVRLSKNYGADGMVLKSNLSIYGDEGATITMLSTHWCLYATYQMEVSDINIEGISFIGRSSYIGTSVGDNLSRDVGICIKDGSNITIDKCRFSNFGDIAVRVLGENTKISRNHIYSDVDYSSGGPEPNYSFGISVDGSSISIEDNIVIGYIQGIISGLNFSDVLISGNYISQRIQHGMYIEGGNNVIITDNIVMSDANALCGIKVQNDQTGDVMRTFLIAGNIIKAGNLGQGILVTGLTAYSSYISDVTIQGNKIRGQRGVEASYVYGLTIADNDIDVSGVSLNTGILIGNVWNSVMPESTVYVRGNRVRAHSCLYMRPSALSTALYKLVLADNLFDCVYDANSSGKPYAVTVTTINEFVASGNRIRAIGEVPNMAGIHFNADTVTNIAILGNSINGFVYDFRLSGTLTQAQQAKFQYNFYDTSLGL